MYVYGRITWAHAYALRDRVELDPKSVSAVRPSSGKICTIMLQWYVTTAYSPPKSFMDVLAGNNTKLG